MGIFGTFKSFESIADRALEFALKVNILYFHCLISYNILNIDFRKDFIFVSLYFRCDNPQKLNLRLYKQ